MVSSTKSTKKSTTSKAKSSSARKSKYETLEMYAKRIGVTYSVAKFCRKRGIDPYKTWGIFWKNYHGRGKDDFLPLAGIFETKKDAEAHIDNHQAKYSNFDFKSAWIVKRLSDAEELDEPRAPVMEGDRRVKGEYH